MIQNFQKLNKVFISKRNADSIEVLSDSDDEGLDKKILKNEPALKNDALEVDQPNLMQVQSISHANYP